MKIFKQTIATGTEWKPCVHCQKSFVFGEIITAIENGTGGNVVYWYCSECFERFWFSPLPAPVPAEDEDFCMVVIRDNKISVCPKRMKQSEYMLRSACSGTQNEQPPWRMSRASENNVNRMEIEK